MRLVATANSTSWATDEKLPDDLVLISVVAMRDQVRPGVSDVVASLRKSGVNVMMITGDILDTARAIARDCGIICADDDIAMTASELDEMSDDMAKSILPRIMPFVAFRSIRRASVPSILSDRSIPSHGRAR